MRVMTRWVLLGVWAALGVSCAHLRQGKTETAAAEVPQEARPEDVAAADEFFKNGGRNGFHPDAANTPELTPENTGFVVELDQQRAYLYHGAKLLAVSKISSGRKSHRTETGRYFIGQKNLNHRSNLYGHYVSADSGSVMVSDVKTTLDPKPEGAVFRGSSMKYFQRFDREPGKPTAMGFHAGTLPGYPASHGCIRLPASMARWFFDNVPKGTLVVIRGSKYGIPPGRASAAPRRAPKVHSSLKKEEPAGTEAGAPAAPDAEAPAPPAQAEVPAPAAQAPAPAPAAPTGEPDAGEAQSGQ